MTKTLCIGLLFLLAGAGAFPARAQLKIVAGDVRWGKPFEKRFGDGFTLNVDLLGGPKSGQDGIYVSVLNERLAKPHQFVVLPELIDGSESNFIGAFVVGRDDPKDRAARLREVLDRYKNAPVKLTYFTQTFNEAQLNRIVEANMTLGHHGESDATYANARKVLDAINKKTAVFTLLDYKLSTDAAGNEAPYITSIRFSFDPDAR